MEDKIYKLALGVSYYDEDLMKDIIRVPGGWIFRTYDFTEDKPLDSGVFVPFNNEFQ